AKMLKYLLLKPLEPKDLSTLKELTTREICQIWAAASRYIRGQLLQKRAVEIGVGTFALVPAHATVQGNMVLPLEIPLFQPTRLIKKFYKLRCAKTKIPDETPQVQLDFEEIAAAIHFQKEIVEKCMQETLFFFAEALRDNKEVEFFFK
ncbi:CCD81 protein, partial [Upupa epops]|nr:CCD81 protein [Upupa epops]